MSILALKNILGVLLLSAFSYPNSSNISSNTAINTATECRVGVVNVIVNGDCANAIYCDGEEYWFDCCSDLGTDLGWCRP